MNGTERALEIVATPIRVGVTQNVQLGALLHRAIMEIIDAAPRRGLAEAAPDAEGLAHLVRVLVAAHKQGVEDTVIGTLKCQLMTLEAFIKEHPGDRASACIRLGSVIARALELLERADDETYPVPAMFRPWVTAEWPFPLPAVA